MPITLRPYQKEVFDEVVLRMKSHKSILISAACGFGKSILIGDLANNISGRVLILTHRKELLEQNSTWLNDYAILDAKSKKPQVLKDAKNVISSAQTIIKRFEKYGSNYAGVFDTIIIDEAHLDFFKKVYDLLDYKNKIGLSATPIVYKSEKKTVNFDDFSRKISMADEYDTLIQGISEADLIDLGYLVEDRYVKLEPPNLDKLKKSSSNPDGYTPDSLTQVFGSNASLDMLFKSYEKYGIGKKCMIFSATTKANAKTYSYFVSRLGTEKVMMYDSVNSKSSERETVVDWFKETDGAVLLNANVFSVGFNATDLEVILFNKKTESLSLFLQVAGRGSRPHDNKKYFTFVDLGLNIDKHGFWSDYRNWSKDFVVHNWKSVTSNDVLQIWECDSCGHYNPRGTYYNEEKDQIECDNCGTAKPKKESKRINIKGELIEVYVARKPNAKSIVSYGEYMNNDANVSFKLLEKKILDLFYYHTFSKDYFDRRNKYIKRIQQIYQPIYFAIINSKLKGKNRTLNQSINKIVKILDKHYER